MRKSIQHPHQAILLTLLRDTRKQAGLKQAELSDRLSKPQSFVSKYEIGERRLDLVELREVCSAMEVSFSDFIAQFDERCNQLKYSKP